MLLVENNNKDPQLQLEVCFRLLILERETTFEKDTPLEQRMVHMKRAEIFGNEALSAAKTVGKAGVQAQVKLQIAFTQAREATIGESLQVGSEDQEVSLRKKKAALQSINSAWQGLKIANRKLYDDDVKLQETKKWWIRELS